MIHDHNLMISCFIQQKVYSSYFGAMVKLKWILLMIFLAGALILVSPDNGDR